MISVDQNYDILFIQGHGKETITDSFAPGAELTGLNMRNLWPNSAVYPALEEVLNGTVVCHKLSYLMARLQTDLSRSTAIQNHRMAARRTQRSLLSVLRTVFSFYTLKILCLTVIFTLQLTPLKETDASGAKVIIGATVVALDITESQETKERLHLSYLEGSQLRASEEAAQEASRLKSRFVSVLSHELRTPVAGMIGLAELLLEERDLKPDHRLQVERIMRSGEILLELVGMVLVGLFFVSDCVGQHLTPFSVSGHGKSRGRQTRIRKPPLRARVSCL